MTSNESGERKFSLTVLIAGVILIICSLALLFVALHLVLIGMKLMLIDNGYGGELLDREELHLALHYAAALFFAAFSFIFLILGVRLIRSQGILVNDTIPAKDYDIVSESIKSGNEDAINLYIKIRSLSGWIGACTKLGLSGLSLATIFLTIFFAFCGLSEPKFYDLAQLMLGAFIGSFVQKKNENNITDSKKRNDSEKGK